jgi:hypothetical protein
MAEDHSFWKRAWHLLMVAGLGAAYFVQAILVGLWHLIKTPFNKNEK